MEDSLKSREELLKVVDSINTNLHLTDIHVELASDERSVEMVEFLAQHFLPDETLSKSLNRVIDDNVKKLLIDRYKDNLSLLLIYDVTKQIIGVRTMKVVSSVGQSINLKDIQDEKIRTIFTFLRHKNDEMDVYKYFGVECAVNFINLAIHKDYRNKGLASTLMKAALQFVKEIGLQPACITGEGTSKNAQKIYEKFDFVVLHTIKYEDYKVDGKVVFKNTGDNETCNFYVKKL